VIALVPVLAALITGMFFGWLLTQIYVHAAISRSQERMQRIVRYWQAEAIGRGAELGQLADGPLSDSGQSYLGPHGG
jgi:hypothetical protein